MSLAESDRVCDTKCDRKVEGKYVMECDGKDATDYDRISEIECH